MNTLEYELLKALYNRYQDTGRRVGSFNYSDDLQEKAKEVNALDNLESDGYITTEARTIGFRQVRITHLGINCIESQ